jgi:hypothetical protein
MSLLTSTIIFLFCFLVLRLDINVNQTISKKVKVIDDLFWTIIQTLLIRCNLRKTIARKLGFYQIYSIST